MSELIILVKVIPKSTKNSVELYDGVLRVHLNAPPVDGKANKALIDFLSEIIKVPKSFIEISHGIKGRNKKVKIKGLDEYTFIQRIQDYNAKK